MFCAIGKIILPVVDSCLHGLGLEKWSLNLSRLSCPCYIYLYRFAIICRVFTLTTLKFVSCFKMQQFNKVLVQLQPAVSLSVQSESWCVWVALGSWNLQVLNWKKINWNTRKVGVSSQKFERLTSIDLNIQYGYNEYEKLLQFTFWFVSQ